MRNAEDNVECGMLNVECGMGCAGVLDGTGILGFLRTLGLISGMG